MISRIKRIVFLNSLIFTFFAGTADAAKLNAATNSSPAQILIEHALIKTAKGHKYAEIRLIAKDKQNLHENQVYQAKIVATHSETPQDASYDEADEIIFIPNLLQNSKTAHQTTLRLVKAKTLEFAVIETTPLATESRSAETGSDMFFDPKAVRNISYEFQDK